MKIRILTYHFITNNGAAMFCYALVNTLKKTFPEADIQILDYRPFRLWLYEFVKQFKLFRKSPLFYYRRAHIFSKYIQSKLPIEKIPIYCQFESQLLVYLSRQAIDCILVGMDVWCITSGSERPAFPNIYWLNPNLPSKKIAYAVSGYNSRSDLIESNAQKISDLTKNFDLIGVRDSYTMSFLKKSNPNQIKNLQRVPDPTFLGVYETDGLQQKLQNLGVNFKQPILGVLLFGENLLSERICETYHNRGYQILALSMFNPYADINLGDKLTPLEWAGTFSFLNFCLTNRFHGTIFSLLAQIPVLGLQTEKLESIENSKIYDLLQSFELQECFFDITNPGNSLESLLKKMTDISLNWEAHFKPGLERHTLEMQAKSTDFIRQIQSLLEEES